MKASDSAEHVFMYPEFGVYVRLQETRKPRLQSCYRKASGMTTLQPEKKVAQQMYHQCSFQSTLEVLCG
jgi:hypothetical protein